MIVVLLAIAAGVRAAVAYFMFGATLDPDTSLYAQGGVGLFPSPAGRLLGVGGQPALALGNIAANVVLVLAVARMAAQLGGRPRFAAAVFVLCPLSWWTIFAGVDTIAAALLLASFVWMPYRWHLAGFGAAVAFHPAALLVVVAYLAIARLRLALWLVAGGLGLAIATPYRAMVLHLDPLTVATGAIATAGIFLLCCPVYLSPVARFVVPAIAGGSIAAGLMAGASWETNARYMLPAVAIGSASLGRLRIPGTRRREVHA